MSFAKVLIVSAVLVSNFAFAQGRTKHSVKGNSASVNAFHHELIECRIANADGISKAHRFCYEEGFTRASRITSDGCKPKVFGGMSVRVSFFCE